MDSGCVGMRVAYFNQSCRSVIIFVVNEVHYKLRSFSIILLNLVCSIMPLKGGSRFNQKVPVQVPECSVLFQAVILDFLGRVIIGSIADS